MGWATVSRSGKKSRRGSRVIKGSLSSVIVPYYIDEVEKSG
jgi:hypothetical protein